MVVSAALTGEASELPAGDPGGYRAMLTDNGSKTFSYLDRFDALLVSVTPLAAGYLDSFSIPVGTVSTLAPRCITAGSFD